MMSKKKAFQYDRPIYDVSYTAKKIEDLCKKYNGKAFSVLKKHIIKHFSDKFHIYCNEGQKCVSFNDAVICCGYVLSVLDE